MRGQQGYSSAFLTSFFVLLFLTIADSECRFFAYPRLIERIRESSKEWEKVEQKCIVVDAQIRFCREPLGGDEFRLLVIIRGFSQDSPEKGSGVKTDCTDNVKELEKKQSSEYKRGATVDCYRSPARSDRFSLGSPPRLGIRAGDIVLLVLCVIVGIAWVGASAWLLLILCSIYFCTRSQTGGRVRRSPSNPETSAETPQGRPVATAPSEVQRSR